MCACRAARRHYGTVTSTSTHKPREPVPRGTPIDPSRRPWSNTINAQPSVAKPQRSPQFYVPSVLLPRDAAQSPTVHKIHILGEDERSKFIAHALSSVYDSVEMLGWRSNSSKYRNIQKARSGNRRTAPNVEANLALPRALAKADSSHIDQLIVTGHGHEAAEALGAVKDRIDNNTTVCLMNDGLGILEDVRKKIFEGSDAAPSFLLGHMNHRLAFNRTYDAVTQLKQGQTKLTLAEVPRMRVKDMQKAESRTNFVKALQEVKDLNSSFTPYDQWLRFKLPSVIFDSVVEPVCVLLEMPYQGLLQNPAAQRMMHGLLSEIITVLENMPELAGSTVIRDYVHSKGIRRFMHSRILGKRLQPSQLARRIENGLPTDVEYLNGYFLRRGQRLGVDLRMNMMMRDMIKAKHSQAIERLNSFIPVEETSVPSHSAFRYRTSPR
ncbi:hypothetical protein QQS21_007665 [Conoideocrella luteorostrata]|uniref:2-dehydropantoate 2-reductase n=1 Tax=Conoideocrella luteorostrata TaxID=1105319 RepID=A0AAJ0FX67_9HYPO|nr:hypothetical protein QQS21_007665 [Conoideocrella luteorostrata]